MFSPSQHLDDRTLVARLDRELSAARAGSVDAHLAGCEQCRARVDALRSAKMSARIALRSDTDAEHHARTRASLTRALEQEARRSSVVGLRWKRAFVPVGAVAVAAMAIVLAYVSRAGTTGQDAAASPLPIARLTPGATASLTAAQLCSGEQPSRSVPVAVARRVLHAYAAEDLSPDDYELDALITPELGGTVTVENLWPQRYSGGVWTAHVKDEIENHLRDLVCAGELDLGTAQRDMATDWIAAYKKYFHRDLPAEAQRSFDAAGGLLIVEGPRDPRPAAEVWRR